LHYSKFTQVNIWLFHESWILNFVHITSQPNLNTTKNQKIMKTTTTKTNTKNNSKNELINNLYSKYITNNVVAASECIRCEAIGND
jgi:hypothetical protein